MNTQKFTKKSLEALQAAQEIAIQHSNTNVDQPHLLYALTVQENGLIPELFKRMGKDPATIAGRLERMIAMIPKVTGSGRDVALTDFSMQPSPSPRIWAMSMYR